MLALIDRLEETIQQHLRDFKTYSGKFQSLFHDYDTTNDALEKELKEFVARRETQRDRVVELHFKMVALTTAEEWKKIIDQEISAIEDTTLVPAPEKEG
jgi:hypothetical protein